MSSLESIGYQNIQQAYGAAPKRPVDIKGTLLEKDENLVRVDIGGGRIVDAKLKEPLEHEVGEVVAIDKSRVITYTIEKKAEETPVIVGNIYSDILKECGLEANDENFEAVELLDEFDIPITKENIEKFMAANQYFQEIRKSLDYDVAIKLIDRSVDIEQDSLQKIANTIQEIKHEKETFSLFKFLGLKKELSTKEAEQVAKQIYGSKMGKDIIDIIKALHKGEVLVTKKNIEKIHEVFYKLNHLKDIDDKVFLEVYEKGKSPTIELLYQTKRTFKTSEVQTIGNIGNWAASLYEGYTVRQSEISNKQVDQLEDQIKYRMEDMGITVTQEHVELGKALIKAGHELSQENMEELIHVKESLKVLIEHLTIDRAAQMVGEGISIDKTSIKVLAKKIEEIVPKENQEEVFKESEGLQHEVVEIVRHLEEMKNIKETDLVKLLHYGVDLKLHHIEKVISSTKSKKDIELNEISYKDKLKVQRLIEKSEKQQLETALREEKTREHGEISISQDQSIKEFEGQAKYRGAEASIERTSKEETNIEEKTVDLRKILIQEQDKKMIATGKSEREAPQSISDRVLVKGLNRVIELSKIFNKVQELSFQNISIHIQRGLPITLKSIDQIQDEVNVKSVERKDNRIDSKLEQQADEFIKENRMRLSLDGLGDGIVKGVGAARTLLQNHLPLSFDNVKRALDAYGQYNRVRSSLSSSIVIESERAGQDLLNMELEELDAYVVRESVEKEDIAGEKKIDESINSKDGSLNKGIAVQKQLPTNTELNTILYKGSSHMKENGLHGNGIEIREEWETDLKANSLKYNKSNPSPDIIKMMDDISSKLGEGKKVIPILMKGGGEFTLKEIQRTSLFMRNQEQFAHKLGEIIQLGSMIQDPILKEKIVKIERQTKRVSDKLKAGEVDVESANEELLQTVNSLSAQMDLGQGQEELKKQFEEMVESYKMQKKMMKLGTVLQIPVEMGGQYENLQIFVQNRLNASKNLSSALTSIVNLSTENLGQVQVELKLVGKEVDAKFFVSEKDDAETIYQHQEILKEMLYTVGYELRSIEVTADPMTIPIVDHERKTNRGVHLNI